MYASALTDEGLANLLPTPVEDKKCCARKSDGTTCGAFARTGSQYCVFHDHSDESRRALTDGRKMGGLVTGLAKAKAKRDRHPLPESVKDLSLESASGVASALGDVFRRVLEGSLDVRTANCLGVLSGAIVKALEVSQLEARLNALEESKFNTSFNYPTYSR